MAAIDVQSEGPSARTVGAILDDAAERIAAAGVEDSRTEAEILVADALGVGPSELSVESAGEVDAEAAAKIERNVQRRVEREPMAYILGRAPFRNLEIYVDERVLWPRRETELLVEVGTTLPEGARVHEIGTGSGAIALALGYAIGRCGCQLSGDGDYGKAWNGPWAMSYPDGTVPTDQAVHPTPIYETLAMGLGAWMLWQLRDRVRPGILFAIYLLYAGAERFGVEFLRRNPTDAIGLTTAQLESLAMIAAGALWIAIVSRRYGGIARPGANGVARARA